MLSSSAFNAFLKTLEEPPAHAIFILATTEKHKILPTILSRCQTYDFNRISVEDIVKNLKSIAVKEGVDAQLEALHVIAQKADGAMRDALTIFDQAVAFCGKVITYDQVISSLNVLDYDYYLRLTNILLEGKHPEALLIFDEILTKGFNALHFIGGLSSHFRDLLVCKDKNTMPLLELAPSFIEKYKEQAALCSLQFLYDALGITSACEAGYKASGHQRLHIEIALIRLCRINSPSWVGETTQKISEPAKKEPEEKPKEEPASAPKQEPSNGNGSGNGNGSAVSISIKNLIKNAGTNGSNKSVSTKADEIGTDKIEIGKLKEVWKQMAEAETAFPRLSTALNQTEPVIKDDKIIIFPVKNELQKKWIEQNCIARLNQFLRTKLNNKELDLVMEVTPDDDPADNKLYMPEEKAKFLIENYPEVKGMKDDLKLELK